MTVSTAYSRGTRIVLALALSAGLWAVLDTVGYMRERAASSSFRYRHGFDPGPARVWTVDSRSEIVSRLRREGFAQVAILPAAAPLTTSVAHTRHGGLRATSIYEADGAHILVTQETATYVPESGRSFVGRSYRVRYTDGGIVYHLPSRWTERGYVVFLRPYRSLEAPIEWRRSPAHDWISASSLEPEVARKPRR